jgi:hypothetical protein
MAEPSPQPDARELALSVKASASSLEAAGQGALADVSCRLADAVLDLARGDEHGKRWRKEHIELRAELARLRPIVEHIAGLVAPEGGFAYGQIHRTLIYEARAALNPGAEEKPE